MATRIGRPPDHGLIDHPLYNVWGGLKDRCLNKNNKDYAKYGGRGIRVCDSWKSSFKTFYDWAIANGWKKGLLIDRRRNSRGYNPQNCRFVNIFISNVNRRKQKNNKSGFTGVRRSWDVEGKPFKAHIGYEGTEYHIGYFDTIIAAVMARDGFILLNKFPHKLQIAL